MTFKQIFSFLFLLGGFLELYGCEQEEEAIQNHLVVQVTDYGAKGDGITDNTRAIQSSVDDVEAHGGGTIILPEGVYLTTDTIMIHNDDIILEGKGQKSEIRIMTHPKRVITIEGARNTIIRDLKLSLGVSGVQRHDNDMGIFVNNGASQFIIENIIGEGKGIMVRDRVDGGIIRNNTIKNTLADGIHLTGGSKNITVQNNDLQNTGDDAIAVVSYEDQKEYTENIKILNNRVTDSHARGISHIGGKNVSILYNTINGTSSSGILVDKDSNYHTFAPFNTNIKGNIITNSGLYGTKKGNQFGIEITAGAVDVDLEENSVKNSHSIGISVLAAGTILKNNISSLNTGIGLEVKAARCVVEGNIVENNGK
jgi:parallel beta-helix repeat protein